MSADQPDRSGQVWESRSKFGDMIATIVGPKTLGGQQLHAAKADDIFGRPFSFTVSEAVLRRNYRRRRDLEG